MFQTLKRWTFFNISDLRVAEKFPKYSCKHLLIVDERRMKTHKYKFMVHSGCWGVKKEQISIELHESIVHFHKSVFCGPSSFPKKLLCIPAIIGFTENIIITEFNLNGN